MLRILLLLILPLQTVWASVEEATVKVFVTKSHPDYKLPWQAKAIQNSSGSGVFVRLQNRDYILTSAHVIGHATFIEVRKNNNIRKFPADVKWVSHETDLALLELNDPGFYSDIEPLVLGDMPKTGDKVTALGYPMGGDELSTTRGVVSRIEHRSYSYSKQAFLTIQIDTPINPGNSGGPIINQHNEIVGIAMQTITKANNISYLVPSRIIRHFFEDIADGQYQGMPHENFDYSLLENPTLQNYFASPAEQSGILIERTYSGDTPLKENDILVRINGHKIENNGTVFLPEGKLSFKELIHQKQIGESVELTVLRNGKRLKMPWKLEAERSNLPTFFADKPPYRLFGGIVLVPLSQNILNELTQSKSLGSIMKAASLREYAKLHPEKSEIVLLQRILPNRQNAGYKANYAIVESVNDHPLQHFENLQKILENGDINLIKFKTHDAATIVIDKQKALKGDEHIRRQYGIS